MGGSFRGNKQRKGDEASKRNCVRNLNTNRLRIHLYEESFFVIELDRTSFPDVVTLHLRPHKD